MLLEILSAVVLALIAVVWTVLPFKWTSRRARALLKKIPGPPGLPLIGNIHEMRVPQEDLLPMIMQLTKTYGPVVKFSSVGINAVVLTHPDDIEVIMNSNKNISKSVAYKFLVPWLGLGLLTSTGSKWHSRRKTLTPTFHFHILQDYIPIFNANSTILVDKLGTLTDAKEIDIGSLITLCTLDIICETAMGTSINAQTRQQDIQYISAVRRMGQLFQHRHFSFWLHPDFLFNLSPTGREQKKVLNILHSFTGKVIKERRSQHRAQKSTPTSGEEGKHKRLSFLDLLIDISEKSGSLSDQDIREEVDTFMFEGHDTTAAGITWTLYLLGCYQEIQEKVYEEMVDVFGSDRREPTAADLNNMPYLTNVIKESLRLYPSVPGISRLLDEDVKIRNYIIPAGTNVPMIPYIVHRNAEFFPNPEEFNPDRFKPEESVGRHPFAYVPFSGGARNCIGQKFALLEEKAVISAVIRNFTLVSLDKREDVKVMNQMILKPVKPVRLTVKRRN